MNELCVIYCVFATCSYDCAFYLGNFIIN